MSGAATTRRAEGAPTGFDTVTFLSDYGTADEFVGVVKSVLRSMAAHAAVIDLTHEIPPHDVRAGALTLARAMQYVAPGVVLAVVDPGVGSDRRGVAVEVAGGAGVLVGPDNGLLAPAVAMAGGAGRAVELNDDEYHLPSPGATFAGRDVFAPVAAHLCNGVSIDDLGQALDPAELLPGVLPLTRKEGGAVVAEVLWIDRYGNAQLNVEPEELGGDGERVRLLVGEAVRIAVVASTYAAIRPGEVGLVIDSYGLISICLDRHSAADELGLRTGGEVRLESLDDDPAPATQVTIGPRRTPS